MYKKGSKIGVFGQSLGNLWANFGLILAKQVLVIIFFSYENLLEASGKSFSTIYTTFNFFRKIT